MKIRTLTASLLAMFMLGACSKSEGEGERPVIQDEKDVAYLSINIQKQGLTRAPSTEQPAVSNEGDIKSIYAFTFNDLGTVTKNPDNGNYYTVVTVGATPETPGAFKISGSSKKLLVIANPGTELVASFGSITSTSTFATINAAIQNVTMAEITDGTKGFTMINSGDDSGLSNGQVLTDPLIDISTKIHYVDGTINATEQDAKNAAEGDRVSVNIERLASKVYLAEKATGAEALPTGADFTLMNWTIDALNSTFYPFAEKTMIDATHTGSYYSNNFYTKDPNFTNNSGIRYTTINPTTYDPQLVTPYGWMNDKDFTYCIENTMAATEQTYENATRLVIKGKYYPVSTWTGDWFHFAGTDYKDLATLKAKYTELGTGSNLAKACDDMFAKLDAYATANSITPWNATDFLSLDQTEMDAITNGGEVIKNGKNPIIRWYQKGLCYYYYEIRHDDTPSLEAMAFGKYGMVRNNWYSLTLSKVNGAGTPWYPDIENPGPGDPDPTDPIDEKAGFLGIDIEVAPWIFWERDIEI